MKKLLFATCVLLTTMSFSQFDYKFNYQAVVRNASGAILPSGTSVSFRLSILEGSSSGTVLYSENQTVVLNNSQGIANLVIGDGTATVGSIVFSGNFSDLSQDKYLRVEVDPAGGSAYVNMGSTKLQFVPYAAHAFSASIAENGTQWGDGPANSIDYSAGNVYIGTSAPTVPAPLSVEKSISVGAVANVVQSNTNSSAIGLRVTTKTTGFTGYSIIGDNDGSGFGILGRTNGTTSGIGIHGHSLGNAGFGVYGQGATGVSARSTATNGIAIDLDGFIKVNGTKTAFKTNPLVSPTTNITLSYSGAASTDMVFVTPISSSTTMPSWALIWTSPNWVLWNASDDAIPSSFPAGTSFNVLIIKQ